MAGGSWTLPTPWSSNGSTCSIISRYLTIAAKIRNPLISTLAYYLFGSEQRAHTLSQTYSLSHSRACTRTHTHTCSRMHAHTHTHAREALIDGSHEVISQNERNACKLFFFEPRGSKNSPFLLCLITGVIILRLPWICNNWVKHQTRAQDMPDLT